MIFLYFFQDCGDTSTTSLRRHRGSSMSSRRCAFGRRRSTTGAWCGAFGLRRPLARWVTSSPACRLLGRRRRRRTHGGAIEPFVRRLLDRMNQCKFSMPFELIHSNWSGQKHGVKSIYGQKEGWLITMNKISPLICMQYGPFRLGLGMRIVRQTQMRPVVTSMSFINMLIYHLLIYSHHHRSWRSYFSLSLKNLSSLFWV